MQAALTSIKKAARAVADRLQAWWARLRVKVTAVAAQITLTAQNIWRRHKTPLIWSLTWVAFGTLATLGLAGAYYTSPPARVWLEETALVVGQVAATPLTWLKGRRPAPPAGVTTAVSPAQPAYPPPPTTQRAIPIPGIPAKAAATAA